MNNETLDGVTELYLKLKYSLRQKKNNILGCQICQKKE
jgi:hypothetical protein